MDQLTVLRKKIAELRAEIAHIHMLNQKLRSENKHAAPSEGYLERQSRLEEIKDELGRLTALAGPAKNSEQSETTERPRRPFLVRKAS